MTQLLLVKNLGLNNNIFLFVLLYKMLLEDLKKRTGLPVHRIEILKIDFLKDIVRMNVFYNAAKNESPSAAIGNDDED